jgi:GTPase
VTEEGAPLIRGERRRATDAEARAVASAVRLRILRLCLSEALTNKELAVRLGRNPATVLHHVRTLVDTGFLEALPPRRGTRGSREVPYRATGKSWLMDLDDRPPATHDAMLAAFLEEVAAVGSRGCRAPAWACACHRPTSRSSAPACTGCSTSTPAGRRTRRGNAGRSISGCIRRPDALYLPMTTSQVTTVQTGTTRVLREQGRATLDAMTTASERQFVDEPDDTTGAYALEERGALRRVAGLSTELTDITEVEYRQLRLERVVLVGVWTEGTAADADRSLAELAALAETAGSVVLEAVSQRRSTPDAGTYVGSGKAAEIRDIVATTGADTVICDGELTPGQLNSLEKILKVKVVDRTALILDIFAQHASSREGKAQVELAQMQYMLPRLRGWGESLSRQAGGRVAGGGGIGTRGPGETKIETDRRRIRARVSKLRKEIAGMATARATQRSSRGRNAVPGVAIAGYTNAGKSSLLNQLTGAGVLVQNALFATLDPTVRRAESPDGREYTLTDTVGFVRHLPHQLVDAFRSTLEEVAAADLLVHVVDGSDPDPLGQIEAVHTVLGEIDAAAVPELIVVNKVDVMSEDDVLTLRQALPGAIWVSARTGAGIDGLREAIAARLPRPDVDVDVLVPYGRGDLVARMHRDGEVLSEQHEPAGTRLTARVDGALAAALEEFAAPVV